jgi:hypothetical protein
MVNQSCPSVEGAAQQRKFYMLRMKLISGCRRVPKVWEVVDASSSAG